MSVAHSPDIVDKIFEELGMASPVEDPREWEINPPTAKEIREAKLRIPKPKPVKTAQITLRIPLNAVEGFTQRAEHKGMTRAALMRRVLCDYIDDSP